MRSRGLERLRGWRRGCLGRATALGLACAAWLPGCQGESHATQVTVEPPPAPTARPREPPAIQSLADPAERAPAGRCPSDMVSVDGDYCIDRYEASLIDHDLGAPLSPYYLPTRQRTTQSHRLWARKRSRASSAGHAQPPVPRPPPHQLERDFEPRAVSERDVVPSGYLNAPLAKRACENAGKRLCTRDEWVRACRGEDDLDYPYGRDYEAGTCNVSRDNHPAAMLHGDASMYHRDPRLNTLSDWSGPLLAKTGNRDRCASRWGDDAVYDMVGNLDEWVNDPFGVFLGGFFSRNTTSGCLARVRVHDPGYFDYSLGVRCCAD